MERRVVRDAGGPAAAPPDDYGLQDPDPPFDPVCAAMVLDSAPPPADGVEVRRVGTFEEHLAGLEVMLAAAEWAPEHAAAER